MDGAFNNIFRSSKSLRYVCHEIRRDNKFARLNWSVMGCLHNPANVQQTSSKCNARRLLEVCWTFAGSCKHPMNQIKFTMKAG